MFTENLFFEIAQDRNSPSDYRVEAIGSDGEVYVVIFSGPDARERAAEYADWKNARQLARAS